MMDSQWLTLAGGWFTALFSIVLVAATAWFSWRLLARSGFTKGMVALESLRMAVVLLAAVTLNQPGCPATGVAPGLPKQARAFRPAAMGCAGFEPLLVLV